MSTTKKTRRDSPQRVAVVRTAYVQAIELRLRATQKALRTSTLEVLRAREDEEAAVRLFHNEETEKQEAERRLADTQARLERSHADCVRSESERRALKDTIAVFVRDADRARAKEAERMTRSSRDFQPFANVAPRLEYSSSLDERAKPPEHFNARCTTTPVIPKPEPSRMVKAVHKAVDVETRRMIAQALKGMKKKGRGSR